jgi:hypothetical protein
MEIHQEKFPTLPHDEEKNDPKAAHNQTVAHQQASIPPKVFAEIGKSLDPNEVRVIPLRPGPLPPEFAKFPKFMWHTMEAPKIVNDEQELADAVRDGYLTEKPTVDDIDKDALKEKIKQTRAYLKQLEATLASAEKK